MEQCNMTYQATDKCAKIYSNRIDTDKNDTTNSENETNSENDTSTQKETIRKLRHKLENLYSCVAKPQIIHIYNFENIKLPSVAHSIKHQVDTLFFEAGIPQTWKIDTKWTITPALVIHVTMLNYLVKEKTKEMLKSYFSTDYHTTYRY